MRVFISWSGPLSRETALALRDTLPCMIQGVKVFLSEHDIESGARWLNQLSKELQESSFGILCLTPRNQESAWLLFEAGALTKHMEGRACGLLLGGLGAADVSGPLAQFQHRQFNKEGCLALVKDVNVNTNTPLTDDQVEAIFDKFWPDLESAYKANLESVNEADQRPPRDTRDIIEEILLRVRDLENTHLEAAHCQLELQAHAFRETVTATRALNQLTQSQRELLGEIADGAALLNDQEVQAAVERGDVADLGELANAGFVVIDDGLVALGETYYKAFNLSGPKTIPRRVRRKLLPTRVQRKLPQLTEISEN